jgi:hypothetical protein
MDLFGLLDEETVTAVLAAFERLASKKAIRYMEIHSSLSRWAAALAEGSGPWERGARLIGDETKLVTRLVSRSEELGLNPRVEEQCYTKVPLGALPCIRTAFL